jgi:aminoacrylate hydrolase
MPTVLNAGCELHWERHGSGPALLLVAGLGGVASYWKPQIASFADRYTVILHDQRGSGRSSHVPVESLEQLANDAVAVMDAAGVERVRFVGHSTGGAIGMTVALDHPDRLAGLVVYASTARPDAYRRKVFELRNALLAHLGPADYARYTSLLLYPSWWINEHAAELEAEEAAIARGFAPAAVQASRMEAILNFDRRPELARVLTPTLVVCAKDDILTPVYFSEEIHQLIPGSRLVLFERGGHACSRTIADHFNQLVLDFLAER